MKAIRLASPFAAFAVCLLALTLAQAKPKKPDVPAIFQNARYVYVEALDGDIFKPGLYPEDRKAITDVQDSLREWNRYAITMDRAQAELVFVVRKGRIAGAQMHGGISAGSPQPRQNPAGSSNPNASQDPFPTHGAEVGAAAEVGPPDDMLRIYLQNDGRLTSIVWNRDLDGGLDAPTMQLIRQLRDAVEKAYPQTTTIDKQP